MSKYDSSKHNENIIELHVKVDQIKKDIEEIKSLYQRVSALEQFKSLVVGAVGVIATVAAFIASKGLNIF